MTIQDWASLSVAIISIFGSVAMGIKWLVKHYLWELRPNGGASLNDLIKLEILPVTHKNNENITTLLVEQAKIKQRVADHLQSHNEGKEN
jgi:hypothetical protein